MRRRPIRRYWASRRTLRSLGAKVGVDSTSRSSSGPNVEKDLVKFQIGWNRELLAAAVLVLPVDREAINPRYTSMPEFGKSARVIGELRPAYPLLLVGISGDHIEP